MTVRIVIEGQGGRRRGALVRLVADALDRAFVPAALAVSARVDVVVEAAAAARQVAGPVEAARGVVVASRPSRRPPRTGRCRRGRDRAGGAVVSCARERRRRRLKGGVAATPKGGVTPPQAAARSPEVP